MAPGFACEVHEDGDVARVVLTGEFDLSVVPGVEDEVRRVEQGASTLVIDLSALEFMDSSGLRTLVSADERARESGRNLVIVQGPPQVHRVFEITQLDRHLNLVPEASAVPGAGS
jgi:anti-sigma B factor antagonist